ncbi:hypothetical protein Tco_0205704 [Tanacetum coccineum]
MVKICDGCQAERGNRHKQKSSDHRLLLTSESFQNEVNEIRSERLPKCKSGSTSYAAMLQPYSDNYYQTPKPQRSNAPSYMQSSSTRPSATTRHKGKEIAKLVTPQSESVSEEDSDPNKLGGDKRMQKELGTLAKYFKKLYKPTNNNYNIFKPPGTRLKITHQRYTNDNQSGEFGNQRTDDKFWGKGNRKASGSATKWGIPCLKSCKGLDTMPGNAGSQRG